jgi:DmsE family decaheme c-type cytochrome
MKGRFWKGALVLLATFALGATVASAKEVDWATLNPAFGGAALVKDAGVCSGCHDGAVATYDKTTHGRVFAYGAKGELQSRNCEACHGPRSQHADNPGNELALADAQQSSVCLQCHQGGNRIYWQSGAHQSAGVGCADCHTVMEKRSEKALLAAADEASVCYSCHADVRAQMQKAYHHPVREGKMTCSDCHNVHGSVGKSLLKGATVNETCFNCHQEKRGPFVWEHAPVRENCANCHDVHGSNQRDLLNAKGSFLCLQCHSYGGHINLPRYNRTSNPYGQGCVNCHLAQHGSNSPSGAKFTR